MMMLMMMMIFVHLCADLNDDDDEEEADDDSEAIRLTMTTVMIPIAYPPRGTRSRSSPRRAQTRVKTS
jgi:hypothetical protein